MIAGSYFVTPHAVAAFRRRIAPRLSYDEALAVIIRGLDETNSTPKPCHSGKAVYLRVRRPYAFRAIIGPGVGPKPAVLTILRSGKGRGGRRRRREQST